MLPLDYTPGCLHKARANWRASEADFLITLSLQKVAFKSQLVSSIFNQLVAETFDVKLSWATSCSTTTSLSLSLKMIASISMLAFASPKRLFIDRN